MTDLTCVRVCVCVFIFIWFLRLLKIKSFRRESKSLKSLANHEEIFEMTIMYYNVPFIYDRLSTPAA